MKRIVYFLCVLVLGCISCTYQVDLKMDSVEAKPVLYCFPSGRDTVLIQLSESKPVVGEQEGMRIDTVQMWLNEKALPVHRADRNLPAVPEGMYYAVATLQPDDEIKVRAETDCYPAVQGKTVLPPAFPLQYLSMERSADGKKLLFHIGLKDRMQKNDFYGVHIRRTEQHWIGDSYTCTEVPVRIDIKEEPLLYEVYGLDEIFHVSDGQPYEFLYVFDDTRIQGKEYTLNLPADYKENYDTEEEGGFPASRVIYHYQVNLYVLSEELFRYLKSLTEMQEDGLGEAGLAPRHPAYTNVVNGLGLVGACHLWQSDWLDNIGE